MEIPPIRNSIFFKIKPDQRYDIQQNFRIISKSDVCILYPDKMDYDSSSGNSTNSSRSNSTINNNNNNNRNNSNRNNNKNKNKNYNNNSNNDSEQDDEQNYHYYSNEEEEIVEGEGSELGPVSSDDEENRMYNVDCGGVNSVYVKIFVQNGFVFIMKRKILTAASRILKRMLLRQSKEGEITALHFREIKPEVMHEFCLYATYANFFRYHWETTYWLYEDPNDLHHNSAATRRKIGPHWEYDFPKDLAYDLHLLANFFMC